MYEPHERDVGSIIALFAFLGIGYLFPFSALTQPVDYWHKTFPDFNIEFPMTMLYSWINTLAVAILVFFGGKEPSYSFRIVGGFIGQILVLIFVPTLHFLNLTEEVHYYMIMGSAAFAAIVTAFIDSVFISFAAQYPSSVIEGLQIGIGLSTLLGSINRIITKALFPPSMTDESTLVYFYAGAVVIMGCIASYYAILAHPISITFLRFGLSLDERQRFSSQDCLDLSQHSSDKDRQQGFTSQSESWSNDEVHTAFTAKDIKDMDKTEGRVTIQGQGQAEESSLLSLRLPPSPLRSDSFGIELDDVHDTSIYSPGMASYESFHSLKASSIDNSPLEADKWVVLRKTLAMNTWSFLLFSSTLLLWPPLITEIKSFNFPYLQESKWWTLILLLLFSSGDVAGRMMTPWRCGLTPYNIGYIVVLRILLFPVIVCSAKGWFFTHDFFSIVFVLVLGQSNGYLGTLCVVMTTEVVLEHEKGLSGTFSGFFINFAIAVGSTIGFYVNEWL